MWGIRSAYSEGIMTSQKPSEGAVPDVVIQILTSYPILLLGTLLSVVSATTVLHGKINRLAFGCDFQWSAFRILLSRRDPWAIYMAGDPHHDYILNQVPNYLHEVYVLLWPFGLLPFAEARIIWTLVNFALIGLACFCIADLYELSRRRIWLLFVMVGVSACFRESIRNGQLNGISIACIALWSLVRAQRNRGLLLGFSYVKYSFPPVLVMFLIIRKRWKLLSFSILPPLVSCL